MSYPTTLATTRIVYSVRPDSHSGKIDRRHVPLSGTWFEVHLIGRMALLEGARLLSRALYTSAHDVYMIQNDAGEEVIAAVIRGSAPAVELERLMRQAELSGYFVPLSGPGGA